jgi:hypothetical protein
MHDDDVSGDAMFIIDDSEGGGGTPSSFWLSNNAGLGVEYTMVTNSGDMLVWSS